MNPNMHNPEARLGTILGKYEGLTAELQAIGFEPNELAKCLAEHLNNLLEGL